MIEQWKLRIGKEEYYRKFKNQEIKNIIKLLIVSFILGSVLTLIFHFAEGERHTDPDYVINNKK